MSPVSRFVAVYLALLLALAVWNLVLRWRADRQRAELTTLSASYDKLQEEVYGLQEDIGAMQDALEERDEMLKDLLSKRAASAKMAKVRRDVPFVISEEP